MEVRFLNVHTVTDEQLIRWESWLSSQKRQRLDRMPPKKRLQSLCGDGLAREMLSCVLGTAPQDVHFAVSETGKPLVDGAYFSVSHSGDMVGCAVSHRPVGLDMECVRPVPQRLRRALEQEDRTDAEFFRLWTKREALLKCRGETIAQWKTTGLWEDSYSFVHPIAAPGYEATVCEPIED